MNSGRRIHVMPGARIVWMVTMKLKPVRIDEKPAMNAAVAASVTLVFDPKIGGDPVLFQHLFWFYSHPAVYIMVLPSMGVVSDAIAAFARKNVFGYKMIAYSSLGIAFVGFFAWGHHMFVSGQSVLDNGAFAAISMLVGVFTAIKVFNWVGTLYRGDIRFTTPMICIS